ncbi:MAG: S8 family serine peptidase [Bacteroidetes bacterium]|nr:S8 family serine peptidase [Bacteroidota bacterium]
MRISFLTILCLLSLSLFAQERYYFVQFKDKDTSVYKLSQPDIYLSTKSIARRKKYGITTNLSDIPVNDTYIKQLLAKGCTWHGVYKWFNGISIIANKDSIDKIISFPFVSHIKEIGKVNVNEDEDDSEEELGLNDRVNILESKFSKEARDTNYYGKSYKQNHLIKTEVLHQNGFKGNNILIAVLDAGFARADKITFLKKLFEDNRIISTWDFVEASSEYPIEEYNWAAAAEYADSAGADIINSSLGYTKFDENNYGHKYKELNGKTTVVSIAANLAVDKGMMVLNSAGNEGNNLWQNIATPADAEKIIAVGATDETGDYVGFSSVGLTADKRIKPDLADMGEEVNVVSKTGNIYKGNGTSYSCPILTGATACLLQAYPQLTPAQLKQIMLLSASQYYEADKYLGYGIPDFDLALKLAKAYDKDTLLDVRTLYNKQMHISLYLKQAQKYEISIYAPIENKIWSDNLKSKLSGPIRVGIKQYKKLKKGVYLLKIKTQDGIYQCEFTKG